MLAEGQGRKKQAILGVIVDTYFVMNRKNGNDILFPFSVKRKILTIE